MAPIKRSIQTSFIASILATIFSFTAQATYLMQAQQQEQQAPIITPFSFSQNVQENQRPSVLCTISSGDLPVNISWLKDGQLLTPSVAQARKITIKPDLDQSTLKFSSVRLDHAGNYTCVAKNRAGTQTHSAQLVVHGEPRWLREPQQEPIVAIKGQTIVIDCQTTGWPKPQQSWQIKTHTQSDFEPLAATGRISLAANGSLVIHNTDKSDEANYLCKSYNGIGKGISRSTSLKVTVPAYFESSKQASVVRKQSQVQLRCDAFGDEPIAVDWYKNKQKISNDQDSRYTIHNKPLVNGLISLLLIKQTQRQDNALYECIARNPAGKDRLPIELIIQEEPDNIQELQATQINSRSATLIWNEPYDGRSPITNYMFQYKKVLDTTSSLAELEMLGSNFEMTDSISLDSSSSGASMKQLSHLASTIADDWQQASRITLPVETNSSGVRTITIDRLEPACKYVLRALAINAIGQSKFSQPLEFTTQDEAPEVGPANIKAFAINSTSVHVSWDEIQKNKQLGRIHGYYIGYRIANTSQNFIYKPYIINDLILQQQHHHHHSKQQHQQQQQQHQNQQPQQDSPNTQMASLAAGSVTRLESVIHDLRRDTAYEFTVVAFNSRGSGPSSDYAVCKTIEMEAPKPVKLQIVRESNESIFVEWKRDPYDQNPVDGYDLYQEKNSASQDWLQVRLPGNQTQYKTSGLKCGTRYQFYIIAHNKVGKSPPSEVVSASTNGALPTAPSKTSLITKSNSTCLLVNLNSFQDQRCRIRTFTVRYRIEKSNTLNGSTLVSSNGFVASHQALSAPDSKGSSGSSGNGASSTSSEWITIRPKSNTKQARANEEDRMEYLCDLNPFDEYTIHVTAANDVGRTEIEYSVLMSSDELRPSALRDLVELMWTILGAFAHVPSIIVFLVAGFLLSLVSLILYITVIRYYQKIVITHNQMRATRRAKRDEKRRRKLNEARHSQKMDLWAEEYDDDDEEDDEDGDDEDEDDDESSANGSSAAFNGRFANSNGHYLSNISNSAFDTSSIDSPCKKFRAGSACMSTASTESVHGRFQCLNTKQYVKMNEYTMLPPISTSLSPPSDIYGTAVHQAAAQQANNSLYYSTLRRTNMQTYLPQQAQQQIQHSRRSQNMSDIYGYYIPPATAVPQSQQQQQQQQQQLPQPPQQQQRAANEAANSIFVPPQQIIYSAPNIRRQPPVFL